MSPFCTGGDGDLGGGGAGVVTGGGGKGSEKKRRGRKKEKKRDNRKNGDQPLFRASRTIMDYVPGMGLVQK